MDTKRPTASGYWFKVSDDLGPLMGLTLSELRAYLFITRQIQRDRRGGAISVRQLAAGINLKSTGHASKVVNSLCQKGLLAASKKPYSTTVFSNPTEWKTTDVRSAIDPECSTPAEHSCSTGAEHYCSTGAEHPCSTPAERNLEIESKRESERSPFLEIELVRRALENATGKQSLPGDRLPFELLKQAGELGAKPEQLSEWIRETGREKARRGVPVRSHAFFRSVMAQELPAWMKRSRVSAPLPFIETDRDRESPPWIPPDADELEMMRQDLPFLTSEQRMVALKHFPELLAEAA